jgi:hypothetical protein
MRGPGRCKGARRRRGAPCRRRSGRYGHFAAFATLGRDRPPPASPRWDSPASSKGRLERIGIVGPLGNVRVAGLREQTGRGVRPLGRGRDGRSGAHTCVDAVPAVLPQTRSSHLAAALAIRARRRPRSVRAGTRLAAGAAATERPAGRPACRAAADRTTGPRAGPPPRRAPPASLRPGTTLDKRGCRRTRTRARAGSRRRRRILLATSAPYRSTAGRGARAYAAPRRTRAA